LPIVARLDTSLLTCRAPYNSNKLFILTKVSFARTENGAIVMFLLSKSFFMSRIAAFFNSLTHKNGLTHSLDLEGLITGNGYPTLSSGSRYSLYFVTPGSQDSRPVSNGLLY
jgi:hypothetical protein